MPTLLFATDFHGDARAYRALLAVAQDLGPEAIVLGGDLSPYPRRAEDTISRERAFVDGPLRSLLSQFAREAEIPVFAIPGNDDWAGLEPAFHTLECDGLLHWISGRAVAWCDDLWLAGLPYVPVTPFYTCDYDRMDGSGWEPDRWPKLCLYTSMDAGVSREGTREELRQRPTIEAELEQLSAASEPARTIYITHSPPHGTKLDVMYNRTSIGSLAVRRFIEKWQPPLTLHGHIHESPVFGGAIVDRIGDTICFNPGNSVGGLQAVLIDTSNPAVSHRAIGRP